MMLPLALLSQLLASDFLNSTYSSCEHHSPMPFACLLHIGGAEAAGAAKELAQMVLGSGATSLDTFGFASQLRTAAEDTGSAGAREGALLAYK
jgi:hypothetical protein